jgi:hypothetical protein
MREGGGTDNGGEGIPRINGIRAHDDPNIVPAIHERLTLHKLRKNSVRVNFKSS